MERIYTTKEYFFEDITLKEIDVYSEEEKSVFLAKVKGPSNWSDMAIKMAYLKYMKPNLKICDYKNNVLNLIHRLVLGLTNSTVEKKYFKGDKKGFEIYKSELRYMLAHNIIAPNTPQWINTGVYEYAFGKDIEGNYNCKTKEDTIRIEKYFNNDTYGYYYSNGKILKSHNRTQSTACFIAGMKDNLVGEDGIFETIFNAANIFKRGSGLGLNFSTLRHKYAPLSGGGFSSGLGSFIKVFDAVAACIKSGGSSRRAAQMITLDGDHPETPELIRTKSIENRKLQSLILGSKLNSDFYNTLFNFLYNKEFKVAKDIINKISYFVYSGKELNEDDLKILPEGSNEFNDIIRKHIDKGISTRTIYNFISTLEFLYSEDQWFLDFNKDEYKEKEYNDHFSKEGVATLTAQNYNMSINVTKDTFKNNKTLIKEITYASFDCGDPAIINIDEVNKYNTVKDETINSSNPCGEYFFIDDTACNLLAINLEKFVFTNNDNFTFFDFETFRKVIRISTYILDASIEISSFPSKKIAKNSYLYRPLGLGFSGLTHTMAMLGYSYTKESAQFPFVVSSAMTSEVYDTSARMVRRKINKPYHTFKENKLNFNKIMGYYYAKTLKSENINLTNDYLSNQLSQSGTIFRNLMKEDVKIGNAQASAIAPTGTVSFILNTSTQGIEPVYGHKVYKETVDNVTIFMESKTFKYSLFNFLKDNSKNLLSTITNALHKDDIEENYKHIVSKIVSIISSDKENLSIKEIVLKNIEGLYDVDKLDWKHLKVANDTDEDLVLHYKDHIDIMSAAQAFITGGISKTINLPFNTKLKDIENLYEYAMEKELKGVTIFRDKCKGDIQPLNISGNKKEKYLENLEKLINTDLNESENTKMICDSCGKEYTIYKGTCSVCVFCGASGGCG